MAIIGKIRKRSGLLFVTILVAMAAFILGDLFSPGGGRIERNVGEIDGEVISAQEFENRVQEELDGLKSTGQNIVPEVREQIRDQVWSQMVRERILLRRALASGVSVNKEEYDDIRFGNNVMPDFKNNQMFLNQETGLFDKQMVRQYFNVIQTNYPLFWRLQRDRLIETRIYNKYTNLIKKGLYVNTLQAERDYWSNNAKASFQFVVKKYTNIPDSVVEVTEADIAAYYEAHKEEEKYQQESSRSIEYVVFDVKPTPEDSAALRDELLELADDFAQTQNDSLFVVVNSDRRVFQEVIYNEGDLSETWDLQIESSDVGTLVGPYEENGRFLLAKIIHKGPVPEVNARHILLETTQDNADEVMKFADSLRSEVKKNQNFAEVAKALSQDLASAKTGGDLDWFTEGTMVPAFNDACFTGRVGDMPIVKTQFGVHLIEILDKRSTDQTKLAIVERNIAPSKLTYDSIYDIASDFSINYTDIEGFNKGVEENNYRRLLAENIKEEDRTIPGLESPRPLIGWMYQAEMGEVSQPLELGPKYVVANLIEINDEGPQPLEKVTDQIEFELAKEKKAALYMKEMSGAASLDDLANQVGESVLSAQDVSFSSFTIPGGGGNEPEVLGKVFTMEEGQLSVPIKGKAGVYVVQMNQISFPDAAAADLEVNRENLQKRFNGRVDYEIYNALEKQATVKDQRGRIYN